MDLVLEVPRSLRSSPEDLLALRVRSGDANALPEPWAVDSAPPLIPLRELVTLERTLIDKTIHHKNLMPVTYVIGDVAGEVESPVYAILEMNKALKQIDPRDYGGTQPSAPTFTMPPSRITTSSPP